MPFAVGTKNAMLDSRTFGQAQLHSGDPGAAETNNAVSTKDTCTFAAAAAGSRALSSNVNFTGMTPVQSVTHFSVWNGANFEGSGTLSGDTQANASGEFNLLAGTTLNLNDS